MEKSPGPDGFNFNFFFRGFWELLKEDFVDMFKEFYLNSKLVHRLNSSFISLIPLAIEEFRPISLISGVYKVVAKVLASRLSKGLEEVFSINQSAFIGERNILDGGSCCKCSD